jgi:two-component system, chemotaxis family, chemotaxis protein CheY
MKLRALVLDDSRVMRSMVMQSLRSTNLAEFEFTEAEDGVEGIAKFDPRTTDIVFADWNMPNMSGIEFVRRVRSTGKTDHIPIVMVTSEKTMGKIEEALDEARASAYICKPFTVEYLHQKLTPIINGMAEKQKKPSGFFGKLVGG